MATGSGGAHFALFSCALFAPALCRRDNGFSVDCYAVTLQGVSLDVWPAQRGAFWAIPSV